jgi:transcriptional regulator with XRE-family HTH domain
MPIFVLDTLCATRIWLTCNSENTMLIGHKIKKIRELRNFTQEYMAVQLEMSQSGYSRIESNDVEVTVSRLERIGEVLGMKPEEILSFDEKYVFNQTNNKTAYGLIINHNHVESSSNTPLDERLSHIEEMLKDLKQRLK